MTSSCGLLIAHIFFTCMYPVLPLVILGISYGIFGAIIWPMVVFLVPKDKFVNNILIKI